MKNIVSKYNRKEGLDYLVGYMVQIPDALADKVGIHYDNELGLCPTVRVEKVRSDKLLPTSILHGEIKYASQEWQLSYVPKDGQGFTSFDNIIYNYPFDAKEVEHLVCTAAEEYEAVYGEYHEESAAKEIDCMLDLPVFQKAEEPLEEDLDNDYEEELG